MLVSPRMGRRQLRSPLVPALALIGAALFFGGGPARSLPWLGAAALLLVLVLVATRSMPGGRSSFVPLALLAVWCAHLGRLVDRARPQLGLREPLRSSTSRSRSSAPSPPAARELVLRPRRAPRRRVRLVARRQGAAVALRGLRPHRPAARARRLLERARAARRHRAPARAVPRDPAALPGRCSSTAGSSRSRSRTRAAAIVVAVVVVVALDRALARLGGGARDARRGGRSRGRRDRVAFALAGVTSDGQSHATRVHDGAPLRRRRARWPRRRRRARPLPAAGADAALRRAALALAVVIAAGCARRRRDARRLVVGRVHEHRRDRGDELARTASPTPARTTAGRGGSRRGAAGRTIRSRGRAPARSASRTSATARRASTGDRAARPAAPVPDRDGRRRARALRRRARLGSRRGRRRRPGPELALALALPAYLLHGLLDIDWDFAAVSAPVFLIAGALAARPVRARRARRRPRCSSARGVALAVVFSLFAVWLGDRWTAQAERDRSTGPHRRSQLAQAGALGQPARASSPLSHAGARSRTLGRASRARALGLSAGDASCSPRTPRPGTARASSTSTYRQLPARCAACARPLHAAEPAGPGGTRSTPAR